MGYIHITAYEGLEPLPNVSVHPDGYIVDHKGDVVKQAICPIIDRTDPKRIQGLEPGKVYRFASGLRIEMCTVYQNLVFLEVLASFARYTPKPPKLSTLMRPCVTAALEKGHGQFYELLALPTNRVIIGPVMSKKLFQDFEVSRDRAKVFDTNLDFQGGFYQQYLCWYQAFALASNNGLLSIY